VKVATDAGITGWGEAHAARAPSAIAELINTTLRQLVTGLDACDPQTVWERVYRMQLASHGAGAAAAIGLSGIDMALWDIRGKAENLPLYALLGGIRRPMRAYAGGIALGYQPLPALLAEIDDVVESGYKAFKLRLGDTPAKDIERLEAARRHVGDGIDILTDVNTSYDLEQVTRIMPALDATQAGWLEEPFPAHAYKQYIAAAKLGRTPLAAGENHYTRFEFERVADDGAITVWQPDLSKTGGITEGLRIAELARSVGASVHPHTSLTCLNMAASIHFLAATAKPGYFEADRSAFNPFRHALCTGGFVEHGDGTVSPLDAPGLGVDIDEARLAEFPVIPGPGYV
jgi:L-alanine-DL-glutamate epimerase-like enolase superfamily enzyme